MYAFRLPKFFIKYLLHCKKAVLTCNNRQGLWSVRGVLIKNYKVSDTYHELSLNPLRTRQKVGELQ